MDQFFEEIKEDVRRDRVIQFLKKYSNYIISIILFLTIVCGGYYGWQAYQKRINLADANLYLQALSLHEDQQTEDALRLLEDLRAHSKTYYKDIAALVYARISAEKGNVIQAKKTLEELATDSKAHSNFRHLAKALMAVAAPENEGPQNLASETIVTNPWSPLILELIAFTKMFAGDKIQASEDFKSLEKNPRTTGGIKTRAAAMVSLINPEGE